METMIHLGDGDEVWAEDSADNGTPVVLLHPGWGDSTIWDAVVARLQGTGARLIRYDARGYGRSPAPTGKFTAVGDLAEVLDRLGVEQAVLVGHSGGGAAAGSLALVRPELLRSLILVSPGIAGYPWPADDPFGLECGRLAEAGDLEGLFALGLRTWAAADQGPAAQAQVRGALTGMEAQHPFLLPDPDAFGRLEQITVPTSMVLGDLEYPMVAECAKAAAARIPGCRLTMVSGVDHMVPLRVPDLLAELIIAELD